LEDDAEISALMCKLLFASGETIKALYSGRF
jgi:hypothetical protein